MEPSPVFLQHGTVVHQRYQLLDEIGRGGSSIVYEAIDLQNGRSVAAKLIIAPSADGQVASKRMRREYAVLRQLDHPYIVQVLDFVEEGPWTLLIMQRVVGRDLQRIVAQSGPLTLETVIAITGNLLHALDVSHNKGILHRDIKPQNILISEDGIARLTDFGSAKVEGITTFTQSGLAGTIDYMDPGLMMGRRSDARSDLYSLGLTLYFALTGKLPLRGSLPEHGVHPAQAKHHIPDWLDQIVARSTSNQAEARFPTAFCMLEALQQGSNAASKLSWPVSSTQCCSICTNPTLPGIPLCNGCIESDQSSSKLVTIVPNPASADSLRTLARVFPQLSSSELRDVQRGAKGLAYVSASLISKLVQHLNGEGISVSVLEKGGWIRLLGWRFPLFCIFVMGAGFYAASSLPLLRWITPLIVSIMVGLAIMEKRRAAIPSFASRSVLPKATHLLVAETFLNLTTHTATTLLSDVVHLGSRMCQSVSKNVWCEDLKMHCSSLIEASCAAVRDLDWIDATLAHLELQRGTFGGEATPWLQTYSRCEEARDQIVQQLLNAVGTFTLLQNELATEPDAVNEKIRTYSEKLASEVDIYSAVVRQLSELTS